jgi:hypothetical protein
MSSRGKVLFGLLALGVAALLALARQGDVLIALLIGLFVLVAGRAVVESGTLLVFACEVCGEQLVLLRKGTDAPPRHCAEKMVLRRIPTPERGPNPN